MLVAAAIAAIVVVTWYLFADVNNFLPEFRPGSAAQTLSRWRVIRNAEAVLGHSDGNAAASDDTVFRALLDPASSPTSEIIDYAEILEFGGLSGKFEGVGPGKNAKEDIVAACNLRTLRPRSVYLMLASDAPVKIYLNSKLIAERHEERAFRLWDNSYRLTLRRGRNLLVIRVTRPSERTAAVAIRLEPDAHRATSTAMAYGGAIVPQPLITGDSEFSLRLRGAPPLKRTKVELLKTDGIAFDSFELLGNRRHLFTPGKLGEAPALFRARIVDAGQVIEIALAHGDPATIGESILRRIRQLSLPETTVLTLRGLSRRLEVLLEPKNYRAKEREWQHSVVFVLHEMEALTRAAENRLYSRNRTGLQLVGFRSEIDHSTQYYRIYMPRLASADRRVPLMVVLPTPVQSNRPFIDSVFLARHLEAEALAAMAERQGVALVWSGYRSAPIGAPIDIRHLDEVIREATSKYNIDSERVHLLGSCAGAVFALQAANAWPGRFAGIGLLNPAFRTLQLRVSNPVLLEVPEYRVWRKANDPIDAFIHNRDSPTVVILHDSMGEPGHGEREDAESFFGETRDGGVDSILLLPPPKPTISYHTDGWSRLITELLPRSPKRPAKELAAEKYPGPLWDVVSRPFVVVVGTGGSQEERLSLAKTAESFRKAWQQTQFVDCRIVSDRELPPEWLQSRNLVLIGNPETNAIWNSLSASINVTLGKEHVSAGGTTIKGLNLVLHAVVSGRRNPHQSIAVIGAQDVESLAGTPMDWSSAGWYHIAAWQPTSEGPSLVAAKNYPQ